MIKILNLFHLNKVSGWKNICFNTQERNFAKQFLEKHFYKLLNKSFYGKTVKNIRKTERLEIVKKMIMKKSLGNNQN